MNKGVKISVAPMTAANVIEGVRRAGVQRLM